VVEKTIDFLGWRQANSMSERERGGTVVKRWREIGVALGRKGKA